MGQWLFFFFFFFFFFERKVVQLAGKPFEGLTVDRLPQRTVCALTVEPRRNHCKKSLESLLIGKTELFRDANCSVLSTDVDQVDRLAAISSALLVPRYAQNLSSRFFYFIYELILLYIFFEMNLEEIKKKKIRR